MILPMWVQLYTSSPWTESHVNLVQERKHAYLCNVTWLSSPESLYVKVKHLVFRQALDYTHIELGNSIQCDPFCTEGASNLLEMVDYHRVWAWATSILLASYFIMPRHTDHACSIGSRVVQPRQLHRHGLCFTLKSWAESLSCTNIIHARL